MFKILSVCVTLTFGLERVHDHEPEFLLERPLIYFLYDTGWKGEACHIPYCPGNNNCMGRGHCNTTFNPPQCTGCADGWMGPGCTDPCTNGVQSPMDSGNCECDPG